MTAHAEVLVTGPAFGAILNGIEELLDPGIEPGNCGLEPPYSNRSATLGPLWGNFSDPQPMYDAGSGEI